MMNLLTLQTETLVAVAGCLSHETRVKALRFILANPESRPKNIFEQTGIAKSKITSIIKDAIGAGLLSEQMQGKSGSKMLTVTGKGKKILLFLKNYEETEIAGFFSQFTTDIKAFIFLVLYREGEMDVVSLMHIVQGKQPTVSITLIEATKKDMAIKRRQGQRTMYRITEFTHQLIKTVVDGDSTITQD